MGRGFRPGERVPGTQYRVIAEIGSGGHGVVYAVVHTFLEAPAVMKLLHAELVERAGVVDRMRREARTLARLRHPNIVEVWDGGITHEAASRPFFVMQPLDGLSLRGVLERVGAGVGIRAALRLAMSLLDGLAHAHRAGVIHRDIKPDNVFLHRTSVDVIVPKILDFGTAHVADGERRSGRHFLGTPRYAAPEQLRGDAPTVQTDIYAVGLVLHQLLTGSAPFAHLRSLDAVLEAHRASELPRIARAVPGAPRALDRLVASMLAKTPSHRPPTASAASVALREILASLETRQAGSIHTPEFQTEPTPMENVLADESSAKVIVVMNGARHVATARSRASSAWHTASSRAAARGHAATAAPSRTLEPSRTLAPSRSVERSRTLEPSRSVEPYRTFAPSLARWAEGRGSGRRAALAVAVALLLLLAACAPVAWERFHP